MPYLCRSGIFYKNFKIIVELSYSIEIILKNDFKNEIDETDMTHLNEVLEKHDFNFDPDAKGIFASFKNRCINNFEYRSLHHHVFSHEVLKKLFLYLDIQIICQYNIPLFHQIIVGNKQ